MTVPCAHERLMMLCLVVASTVSCVVDLPEDDAPGSTLQLSDEQGEGDDDDPTDYDREVVDRKNSALMGGREGVITEGVPGFAPPPPAGAVELNTPSMQCSGVLMGSSMVLTVGHCLKPGRHGLPPKSGYMNGTIRLAVPSGGPPRWVCISGGETLPDGWCANLAALSYERYDAPDSTTTGADFMVVFSSNPPQPFGGGVAHLAARTIWAGNMGGGDVLSASMVVYGRGFASPEGGGLGIMRYVQFPIASATYDKGSFRWKQTREKRICLGDSGGPIIDDSLLNSTYGALLGLTSRVDRTTTSCGNSGDHAEAVKLSPQKLDWINEKRRIHNLPPCDRPSNFSMVCND